MVTAELFRRVSAAIAVVVEPDTPIDEIRIQDPPTGPLRISLTTSKPGRLIGRRGATADALRARLVDELGRDVELDILEAPPQAPPSAPPAGVREPRRPRPGAPPVSASLRPHRPPEEAAPPFTGRPVPPPSGDDSPRRRGAA
jgi:predicted RNA-binding protein YlqC (UPF0109 family)